MRVLLRIVLLGVMVASLGRARALADPPPEPDKASLKLAKQYVDAGLAAQDAGDYDRAIDLYTKAYQVVAHPVLLFNLAQAHRLAGRGERAIRFYTRYLEEDPHGARAPTARGLLAELKKRQAELDKRKPGDEPNKAQTDAHKPPAGEARADEPDRRKPPTEDARKSATDDKRKPPTDDKYRAARDEPQARKPTDDPRKADKAEIAARSPATDDKRKPPTDDKYRAARDEPQARKPTDDPRKADKAEIAARSPAADDKRKPPTDDKYRAARDEPQARKPTDDPRKADKAEIAARSSAADDLHKAEPQARKPVTEDKRRGARDEPQARKPTDDPHRADKVGANKAEADKAGANKAEADKVGANKAQADKAGPEDRAEIAARSPAADETRVARTTAPADPTPVGGDAGSAVAADHAQPARGLDRTVWQWVLGASIVVAVGGTGLVLYGDMRTHDEAVKLQSNLTDNDCGKANLTFVTPADRQAFHNACDWHSRAVVGYVVTGVALGSVLLATIVLIRDPGPADTQAIQPRGKRAVAVAPIVMPSGGGAALSLTW